MRLAEREANLVIRLEQSPGFNQLFRTKFTKPHKK